MSNKIEDFLKKLKEAHNKNDYSVCIVPQYMLTKDFDEYVTNEVIQELKKTNIIDETIKVKDTLYIHLTDNGQSVLSGL